MRIVTFTFLLRAGGVIYSIARSSSNIIDHIRHESFWFLLRDGFLYSRGRLESFRTTPPNYTERTQMKRRCGVWRNQMCHFLCERMAAPWSDAFISDAARFLLCFLGECEVLYVAPPSSRAERAASLSNPGNGDRMKPVSSLKNKLLQEIHRTLSPCETPAVGVSSGMKRERRGPGGT